MSWILVTHELKRWTSVVEQTSSGITRWHNITTWCWSYSNLKLGCGSYYIRVSGIDGGIFYCQRNRIEDWNSERSFNRTLCKVKRIMILGLNIVTFSGGGGGVTDSALLCDILIQPFLCLKSSLLALNTLDRIQPLSCFFNSSVLLYFKPTHVYSFYVWIHDVIMTLINIPLIFYWI